jgi:hypothetical protein
MRAEMRAETCDESRHIQDIQALVRLEAELEIQARVLIDRTSCAYRAERREGTAFISPLVERTALISPLYSLSSLRL